MISVYCQVPGVNQYMDLSSSIMASGDFQATFLNDAVSYPLHCNNKIWL